MSYYMHLQSILSKMRLVIWSGPGKQLHSKSRKVAEIDTSWDALISCVVIMGTYQSVGSRTHGQEMVALTFQYECDMRVVWRKEWERKIQTWSRRCRIIRCERCISVSRSTIKHCDLQIETETGKGQRFSGIFHWLQVICTKCKRSSIL